MTNNRPRLTIRALAESLDVSIAVVSKALNNRPGVAAETRLRIQSAAEEFGYSPYASARRSGMLAPGGRHLAVLFGPVGSPLVREVQQGIDATLRNSGLFEIRCNLAPEDPGKEEVKRGFLHKIEGDPSIAGLLAFCVTVEASTLAILGRRRIPIVHLDGDPAIRRGHVLLDHAAASRLAIKALVAAGRRRLAYIGPRPDLGWVWEARHRGAREAADRAGAVFHYEEESWCDMVKAGLATRRLLLAAPEIDGIVYGADVQALGGLKMLGEMAVAIPERIAVVGFDDSDFCRVTAPPLSSIEQPFRRMGEEGARLLLESIRTRRMPLRRIVLPARINLRGSVIKDSDADRWHYEAAL
jgi:DNA-binding LacI/PurR family transcriptional regulator